MNQSANGLNGNLQKGYRTQFDLRCSKIKMGATPDTTKHSLALDSVMSRMHCSMCVCVPVCLSLVVEIQLRGSKNTLSSSYK